MSTIIEVKKKCAVCGKENEIIVCNSFHSFGYCDLDMRPAECLRSMLFLEMESCDKCGFVSSNIEDKKYADAYKKICEYAWFKKTNGINFKNELPRKFYQIHLLNREIHSVELSLYFLQNASWACDDLNENDNALKCRIEAISILEKLISNNDQNMENYMLIKLDFLRRCKKFNQVLNNYNNFIFSKEEYKKVFEFEKHLAINKDSKCHNYGEALSFSEENFLKNKS